MSKPHDCVQRMNAALAEHNTQIAVAISFTEPSRELIKVTTCKTDSGKRGKPMTVLATFCPFCGKSLAKETTP